MDKRKAQVLSTSGEEVQLMDLETFETFHLKVDEELRKKTGCRVRNTVCFIHGHAKDIRIVIALRNHRKTAVAAHRHSRPC